MVIRILNNPDDYECIYDIFDTLERLKEDYDTMNIYAATSNAAVFNSRNAHSIANSFKEAMDVIRLLQERLEDMSIRENYLSERLTDVEAELDRFKEQYKVMTNKVSGDKE